MSIFDDLGKTISSAASQTAQKTKDVAEITRLSFALNNKENDLEEKYAKMGKIFCEKYAELMPAELAEQLETIEGIHKEMESMRKKLLLLKNVVICEECDSENAPSAKFCAHCGAKLAEQIPVVKAEPVEDLSEELFEEEAEEEKIEEVEKNKED